MGNEVTDQILVQRVKRGEKVAFDALVLRYQSRIVSLVSRFVRNPTDALDVTQEAFLKAYRALPSFRGESAFYTWMYRIAVNTAKNYLAAQVRRPQEMDSPDPDLEQFELENAAVEMDTPEHLLLTEEIQNTVIAAIDALPEDLRTAITLRELDGLSYEEIAVAMECPVGTVRSRIFRAREAIDLKLKPLLDN
ncbi:MAG: RNA polymerase sigma factor RpoE [Gammaproteobacteria bacterium RIFCSPLOWO2_02_FULL_61_13]|nr:MAG: RNA polymerase sigma factor RpoE [Gammaproteobacteria bacterium RIFCSPLOWO2_02_FULL_61_13]